MNWERRPVDIESDLLKYRKTVQKTRDELRNAEQELEAVTAVDNFLRRDGNTAPHKLHSFCISFNNLM